ncbi:hypothetical protein FSP39_008363 [Pinctada imbricata]|uniref:Death domain-containing protein n=1 Tax=Pinctada imbricata TaxID=66713 RepID=A0AA89C5M5_PINIB|nr:hypothetical protein FSP39_008363 [Pinctada imbricata]
MKIEFALPVLATDDLCPEYGSESELLPLDTSSDGGDAMKNKPISNQCSVSVTTMNRDAILDDDAHLHVSYTPGKKGGNFGLPLGGKLSIPDGLFTKKQNISCQVAAPSQRWRHLPTLPSYEHMTSEIFILNSSLHPLKKNIIVQIPYYQIDTDHNEVNVKGKWKDENEWIDVGFLKKESSTSPMVELEIDRLGSFVVTFTPKREVFEVTPQGCLYNAHISRYITLRFPKKAYDKPFQCAIQILPIPPDKLQLAKEFYPGETSDLAQASEFIDLLPSMPCTFKRAASVKLPLPAGVEVEGETNNDIAVLMKTGTGWEIVESKYKFTRTTVTFETKSLARFCVMLAKPDRRKRLLAAAPALEGRADKERGEVIAFVALQEKFWFMVLECFPESKVEARKKEMIGKGFVAMTKELVKQDDPMEKNYFRRQPKTATTNNRGPPPGFEIFDGMTWDINITDDVKASFDSDYMENKELHYFKYLPESYRKFVIEPKTNEERAITGAINLMPIGLTDKKLKENSVFTIKLDIDEEKVKAYFKPEFVPEEPEPKKEKPNFDILNTPKLPEEKPTLPVIQKFKPLPPTVMERLMRTSRKPIIIEKESKALSGKSLRNLSRMVPEGLTLAVHLDLPDSTITGIGFDAISNGLSMSDVTYKILLYWKRTCKDKKDGAVNALTSALRDMGRGDIASVVHDQHVANKELTFDAFTVLLQPS